jgi:Tfp pilus assembly protein PilO
MRKYMNPIGAGGVASPAATDFNSPGARMAIARKVGYFMLGIAVLLLLLGCVGFYLLNGQIQSVQKVEADKRAQVGSSQQITRRYDATLAEYNATELQLKFLEKPQPQNMYVPTMLPQIQTLAQTSDCQIKSIAPQALVASAPPAAAGSSPSATVTGPVVEYEIMPVNIDMTGTYSQVMHFVYNLTQFPKIVTVKSISLHPASGTPTAPGSKAATEVEADLQLQSYVFQDDDTSPTGSASAPATATTAAAPTSSSRPAAVSPAITASPTAAAVSSTPANASAKANPASSASSDPAVQAINGPIAAALNVQSQTEQRVESSGLQSEPTTPTLPINKNLGK